MTRKSGTALLSVASNTTLIGMKLVIGVITGSVSIISEAIHSMMDLAAAVIAFFSVRLSDQPPDKKHPYGHDKIENFSGMIEAILILIASGWIIFEAVKKIMHPEEINHPGLGFMVMLVSALVNFFVSGQLYKVAKQEDSIALEADALHLKADVITSAGVGIGLLIIWVTRLYFLDPIIAILIALFILKEAIELMIKAFEPLLDTSLSDDELIIVRGAIEAHQEIICDYHDLRTRKAGKTRHVDLHLTVHQKLTVKEGHDICEAIEHSIEDKIKNTEVLIHIEPCAEGCVKCSCKSV